VVVTPGIELSCPAGADACTASATASVQLSTTATKHTKQLVIARTRARVAAGKHKAFVFTLTRQGAQLLAKRVHLRVKFTVVSRVGHYGPITTTKTITIKSPAGQRRR
jgi:hypothetical protein